MYGRWTSSRASSPTSAVGGEVALVGSTWPSPRPRPATGRWAGRGAARVGASIWQTPGGVQAELNQINDAFLAFSHEIFERVTGSPGYPSPADPIDRGIMILHDSVWSPLIRAWQAFYADNKGWTDNLWWNHGPEAESYLRQLIEVRESAKRLGMSVRTPTPPQPGRSILFDPEKNVLDEGYKGAKRVVEDTFDLAKIALYAALGVGGIAVAIAVSNKTKGGR